jgi:hypothetical protein
MSALTNGRVCAIRSCTGLAPVIFSAPNHTKTAARARRSTVGATRALIATARSTIAAPGIRVGTSGWAGTSGVRVFRAVDCAISTMVISSRSGGRAVCAAVDRKRNRLGPGFRRRWSSGLP